MHPKLVSSQRPTTRAVKLKSPHTYVHVLSRFCLNAAHSRAIFSMAALGPAGPECHGNHVITCSLDRTIALWDTRHKRTVYRLPGLGGFVTSISASYRSPPAAPQEGKDTQAADTLLALAVGDGMLRLWNCAPAVHHSSQCQQTDPASDPQLIRPDPYACRSLWQGFEKVNSVVWHPFQVVVTWYPPTMCTHTRTQARILACGFMDGTVAVFEVASSARELMRSKRHRGQVYSLSWQPLPAGPDRTELDAILYSCGKDGKLLKVSSPYRVWRLTTMVVRSGVSLVPTRIVRRAYKPPSQEQKQPQP